MITSQFFIILGTIYLVPDMPNIYRKWIGVAFILLAALSEFL
jgi:hypothetical protein